jgi:hypothetical protein
LAKFADEYVSNRGGSDYWETHRNSETDTSRNGRMRYKQTTALNTTFYRPSNQRGRPDVPVPYEQARVVRQQQNKSGYRGPSKKTFPVTAGNLLNKQKAQDGNKPQNDNRGQPNKRFRSNQPQQQNMQNPQNQQGNQKCPNQNRGKYNACRCEQTQNMAGLNQHGKYGRPKNSGDNRFLIPGKLEHKNVQIFRDSGCNKTAVNQKLVPASCMTGDTISIKGIEGDIQAPTARVHIQSERFTGQVEVVVIDDLDYDVLLGRELDSWDDLTPPNILVLTRAQKKNALHEIVAQDDMRNFVEQNKQNETLKKSENNPGKQDKQIIQENTVVDKAVQSLLQGNVQELNLQNQDPTLAGIKQSLVTQQKIKDQNTGYYRDQTGIMMRKCPKETKIRKQVEDQIILPTRYRQHVVDIAHDKSGHLGVLKTTDNIFLGRI